WGAGGSLALAGRAAVRRLAWPRADEAPDWRLAGGAGVAARRLDVAEAHPVGRTVLNGTVETNEPAGWIASIQDSSRAEHTNITVGNFIVDCTVGDGVVSVTATGPDDQVHTLEQRLAAVRW